jgi:threonine dehydrogenase-like Zn-dependent dehydrogenase
MNVFRRCDIKPGQFVAVVGVGFLGALLVQLASKAGARVFALSRRPFALNVARQCGAEETALLDSAEASGKVFDWTGGGGCDQVIEAVGAQSSLDLAGSLVRVRGRLIIAGYHQDGPRQINLQDWNWRGLDVINAHERDPQVYADGMRQAVDEIASGGIDPALLFTHDYALDEIEAGFRAALRRPDGFLKSLIWNVGSERCES